MDTLVCVALAAVFTVALTAWSFCRWLYEPDELPGLTTVLHDLGILRAALHVHAAAEDAITALHREATRWER